MISEQDEVVLQAYLDGELSPEESARVELRLANSAEWRRAEQELRELLGHCSQHFAVVDDDDSALQRALSARHEEAPATRAAPDSTPGVKPMDVKPMGVTPITVAASRRRGWRMPALVLAAAALLVAVGLGTLQRVGTPDRTIVASGTETSPSPTMPTTTASPTTPGPVGGTTDSVMPAPEPGATPAPVPDRPEYTRPEDTRAQAPPTPPVTSPSSPAPRTDTPALPAIELAGLTPTSSAVDTTFGMYVVSETYEVRPGVVVTLEAMESETMVATRSGRGGTGRVDTTAVVQPMDDGLALVWRLPSGVTVRLKGDLPEAELRRLREQVRVSAGRQR